MFYIKLNIRLYTYLRIFSGLILAVEKKTIDKGVQQVTDQKKVNNFVPKWYVAHIQQKSDCIL